MRNKHCAPRLTALACGLSLALGAAAAERTRFALFTADHHPAGEQVVEREDDGLVKVRFIFKDNGRGPELTERFRLAADGTPTEYHVNGSAELGGPVDERFVRNGDSAHWQSAAERGNVSQGASGAFYVPCLSGCHRQPLDVVVRDFAA